MCNALTKSDAVLLHPWLPYSRKLQTCGKLAVPRGVNSIQARNARVVARDRECTAILLDEPRRGKVCGKPSEQAHHWYPKSQSALRENEDHMQSVCANCHKQAHLWEGDFPPLNVPGALPFRLDVPNWPRRSK